MKVISQQKQDYDGTSSLNIIAVEYGDTDSDVEEIKTDSTTENQCTMSQIQTQTIQQYRTVEETLSCEEFDSEDDSNSSIDISSSNSSSSSSSSSSDSSSDSDSDDTASTNNRKNENKASQVKKKDKYVNELDDLPPIEDLHISVPEVLCNPLGEIEKIVEQLVIVKPKPGEPTLNLDTILFVNRGTKALGKIFDVFGSVNKPYYCVRFNDAKHIQENGIKVGMQVYYCPSNTEYTSLVFLHELTKIKACDTVGDEESPDFSNDEDEQAYERQKKQKNNKDSSDSKTSQKRQRRMGSYNNTTMSWQSNHPWNQNRNVQSQRYNRKRQHNWRDNSAQNDSYSYNESWQQYPYQNNAYWQPIPENTYLMSNGLHGGCRTSHERSYLQHGNSNTSDGANQYYQSVESNFQSNNIQSQYPRIFFGAPPRFNSCSPAMTNYQFSNASYSYMNMPSYSNYTQPPMSTTNTNSYCFASVPPSFSDTKDTTKY